MKNFANLAVEVLTNEELMSVRGGDAPVDPIIIRNGPAQNYSLCAAATTTVTTTVTTTTTSF